MSGTGQLIFFCGKMGSGKTTLSKIIVENELGVLLSEDHWLAAHFPGSINTFSDYIRYSNQIKPFLKSLVINLLTTKNTVVMDFPANTRKQRQWFKNICDEAGCEHKLMYLPVSNETCLARLEIRRVEQPERAQFDTETVFNEVTNYFEAPADHEGLNIIYYS